MPTQPKNETFLAAELAAIGIAPGRAAIAAHELCKMGRRYFRLSERLCGGEDEWGPHPHAQARIERAEKARSRLRKRIELRALDVDPKASLAGETKHPSVVVDDDGGGLGLVVRTERKHEGTRSMVREVTALR